jgi:sugar-specific transcriptional regulator TrmB
MAATALTIDQKSEEFLHDFKRLGFSEYEARVYMQLLRSSPATAYEAAKACGVPRPNTYNALETLTQRGAVMPISENPVRYVATSPARHFEAISRQTNAVCESLAQRLKEIETPGDDPYVWNIRGADLVREKIDALIASSESSIRIKAADSIVRLHSDVLKRAAKRGVDILIVLFGDDADQFRFSKNCRVYLHEGNGVRMGDADNLFTLTSDHLEMLTTSIDDTVAFHTRNKAVVRMADTLIRHDFYMAEIFTRFGSQIDATFGPHLQDLRMKTFSPEQRDTFVKRTGLKRSEQGHRTRRPRG